MFSQFIEECSFVSDRHACLEFFDECVQKVCLKGFCTCRTICLCFFLFFLGTESVCVNVLIVIVA